MWPMIRLIGDDFGDNIDRDLDADLTKLVQLASLSQCDSGVNASKPELRRTIPHQWNFAEFG